jgi:glycosyltransferase involved in cell wall biosynthesis
LKHIRVALLTRSLEVGGAEVQLSLLARNLDPDQFEVTVITLYERGTLLEELKSAAIPVSGIGKQGRWDLFGPLRRLAKILKELEPDIIHSFLAPPNIMAAVVKPQLDRCRVVWGFRASNMDLAQYDWSFRATEALQRLLVRRADRIVANSEAGRRFAISRGFPGNLQLVIPNGIDTEKFVRDPAAGRSIRDNWGIPPESHLIGIVARLDPMKDHKTFFRAAAMAVRSGQDLRFVCVGDGPPAYRAEIQAVAADLGLTRVLDWTGERRDLPEIYSALDSATLSSAFGEGFPNTVGEAMACEVPCAVTDVGDAAIVVGETGISVPHGQPESLAAAWATLASENPERKRARAQNCRKRIVETFSVAAMVKAHASLYYSLVSASREVN